MKIKIILKKRFRINLSLIVVIALFLTTNVSAQLIDDGTGTTLKTADNILLEQPNTSVNGNLLFKMYNGGGNRKQYILWEENSSNLSNSGNYWFKMEYEGSNCTNCGDNFKFISEQAGDIMTIDPITGNVTFHHGVNIPGGTNSLWSENAGNIYFNTGNVGLGTNTPSQKLDVIGNIKATGFIGNGSQLTNLNSSVLTGALPVIDGSQLTNLSINQFNDFPNNTGGSGDSEWLSGTGEAGEIYFSPGNVGVGTSNPSDKLDVVGNVALDMKESNDGGLYKSSMLRFTHNDAVKGNIRVDENGSIAVSNHIGQGFYVEPSGKVGVGTALPSEKLEVNGNVRAIKFFGDGSELTNMPPASKWVETLEGTNKIHYSTGNVGVGTSNPSDRLDVVGNVALEMKESNDGGLYKSSILKFTHNDALKGNIRVDENGSISVYNHIGQGFYVEPSGKVGVGTALPNEKLQVNGNIRADSIKALTIVADKFVKSDGQPFFAPPNTLWNPAGPNITPDNGKGLYIIGNVGIGTASPQEKLHIEGNAQIRGNIYLDNQYDDNAIYTWNKSDADGNWRIGMNLNPGFNRAMATSHVEYLTYYNAPGQGFAVGVNGGDSSFEITGSDHNAFFRGNVGMGTSSPSEKLEVVGNIEINAEDVPGEIDSSVLRFKNPQDATTGFIRADEFNNMKISNSSGAEINLSSSGNIVVNGNTNIEGTIDTNEYLLDGKPFADFDNVDDGEEELTITADQFHIVDPDDGAVLFSTATGVTGTERNYLSIADINNRKEPRMYFIYDGIRNSNMSAADRKRQYMLSASSSMDQVDEFSLFSRYNVPVENDHDENSIEDRHNKVFTFKTEDLRTDNPVNTLLVDNIESSNIKFLQKDNPDKFFTTSYVNDNLVFKNHTGTTLSESLITLTKDGSLGIGVGALNPQEKLHMKGGGMLIEQATGGAAILQLQQDNFKMDMNWREDGFFIMNVNGGATEGKGIMARVNKFGVGKFNLGTIPEANLHVLGSTKIESNEVKLEIDNQEINGQKSMGISTETNHNLFIGTNDVNRILIGRDGHVQIAHKDNTEFFGVSDINQNKFALTVQKGIISEDMAIASNENWADYVFAADYTPMPLEELEAYVQKNKHLPGIVSEGQINEEGFYQVDDVIKGQLKNLEEQVLHNIAQEKKIKEQEVKLKAQAEKLERLEQLVEKLLKDKN